MTQPLPPEPHDGVKSDTGPDTVSREADQSPGLARAGSSGVFSPGPEPADEQPSQAIEGGTSGGDALSGVTADVDGVADVDDAVSGDTGPEHAGRRDAPA